jgi:cytoskeleton protein RodZ
LVGEHLQGEGMDEDKVATSSSTVGARLKAARTKQKMSLEDIAAQTRIPLRHLESVEESAWDRLPAPTYTIGFAKAYAGAVGMDRAEVSEQLREELGGVSYKVTSTDTFEPVDPARTMPKWLVIGAIAGVLLLVLLLSWLNERSLESEEPAANIAAPVASAPARPTPAQPAAQGPVVLSALEQVWLQVYDKGGTSYFSGMLNQGQTFTVPPSATAPLLKTAKPEGLRINVGSAIAPTVGPAGKMISDVSLLPADLLRGGAAPAPPAAAPAPAATTAASRLPPPRPRTARRTPPAAPPPPAPAPAPEPQPEVNGAAD